jgi:hypothetical protein
MFSVASGVYHIPVAAKWLAYKTFSVASGVYHNAATAKVVIAYKTFSVASGVYHNAATAKVVSLQNVFGCASIRIKLLFLLRVGFIILESQRSFLTKCFWFFFCLVFPARPTGAARRVVPRGAAWLIDPGWGFRLRVGFITLQSQQICLLT